MRVLLIHFRYHLNLHPYSEDTKIRIMKSAIVTIVPSHQFNLKTFYKKQLTNFQNMKEKIETKEWKVRERKVEPPKLDQDEYDDYMDEMEEWNKIKKRMYN